MSHKYYTSQPVHVPSIIKIKGANIINDETGLLKYRNLSQF